MKDRWAHIEQLYHDALARDKDERSAFLREACGGDEALQREVESLLFYASDAQKFMHAPAIEMAAGFVASGKMARLPAGQRFGLYEIGPLLGAGGMGEVYRARDVKLGRDVAIKILPEAFIADADRRARFEREARLLASLNHPHIGAIYGFEDRDGIHALVLELVDGETLAEKLARTSGLKAKGLELSEALAIARQIADALEAAHEKGIIHRDLKPSNIMLSAGDRVKVLDFGLAKAGWAGEAGAVGDDLTHSPTVTVAGTRDGVILGTAPYMSPEQTRGKIVDKRTDIWAFGCVLYEMLTGRKAFAGDTVSDTIAAILGGEPDWSALPETTPSPIRRLLQRCLEKDPKRRVHDIADARIEIDDALAAPASIDAPPAPSRPRAPHWAPWLIGAAGAVALIASAAYWSRLWRTPDPPPAYHQLTFRRGSVSGARFAPDGRTIMYSAAWEGGPVGLFSTRIDSPESASLPLASADLLSISSSGRMAIRLRDDRSSRRVGTLAEMPLAGQAPRQLLTDAEDADWAPSGDALVVSHTVQGRTRLEYPAGTALYDPGPGRPIRYPRFSPKGDLIGFTDVTGTEFGGGSQIVVVDLIGHAKVLSQGWGDVFGLAWAADGNEIWFSAREAASRSGGLVLHAVTLSGQHRVVARTPGNLIIQEVWRDGRVLLKHDNWPATLICQTPGATGERDLSWLDFSRARDISADGRFVLFGEDGYAEGSKSGVYLRKTDGSPAIRLGDGKAVALSPDGGSAIAIDRESPSQLKILPTGPGQARMLRGEELTYLSASWFPDGAHLLCGGQEAGHAPALYVQDVAGGVPRRIVDGADRGVVSPDGRTIATIGPDSSVTLTPIDGGPARVVRRLPPVTSVLQWADTGRHLFLRGALFERPTKIFRLDLESGRADLWRTLGPADLSGVDSIDISLTPDGRSYCYSYIRVLSSVFVVDGLK